MNVVRSVLTKAKRNTHVVYIAGNHDEAIRKLLLHNNDRYAWFGGVLVSNELVHTTSSRLRFSVLHGDQFDNEVANIEWLNKLGDLGYSILLNLNKPVQYIRSVLGYESHWSLSQTIKRKVKEAVLFTNKYHQMAIDKGREL